MRKSTVCAYATIVVVRRPPRHCLISLLLIVNNDRRLESSAIISAMLVKVGTKVLPLLGLSKQWSLLMIQIEASSFHAL